MDIFILENSRFQTGKNGSIMWVDCFNGLVVWENPRTENNDFTSKETG